MAAKYDEDEKPQVQLTSMMDCIFLMLIFFLVSSQLKKIEKEIPLELPVADATQDVKATPDLVTVSVDAKGDLYVNSKEILDKMIKKLSSIEGIENVSRTAL